MCTRVHQGPCAFLVAKRPEDELELQWIWAIWYGCWEPNLGPKTKIYSANQHQPQSHTAPWCHTPWARHNQRNPRAFFFLGSLASHAYTSLTVKIREGTRTFLPSLRTARKRNRQNCGHCHPWPLMSVKYHASGSDHFEMVISLLPHSSRPVGGGWIQGHSAWCKPTPIRILNPSTALLGSGFST